MPCNSDHLNQTDRERLLQETAKLYVYVLRQLGWDIPGDLKVAANMYYCDKDYVPDLCKTLAGLKKKNKKTFDKLVYNGKDAQSRQLADWYESHTKADADRKRNEAAIKRQERLVKSAKSKLTRAELKALKG